MNFSNFMDATLFMILALFVGAVMVIAVLMARLPKSNGNRRRLEKGASGYDAAGNPIMFTPGSDGTSLPGDSGSPHPGHHGHHGGFDAGSGSHHGGFDAGGGGGFDGGGGGHH